MGESTRECSCDTEKLTNPDARMEMMFRGCGTGTRGFNEADAGNQTRDQVWSLSDKWQLLWTCLFVRRSHTWFIEGKSLLTFITLQKTSHLYVKRWVATHRCVLPNFCRKTKRSFLQLLMFNKNYFAVIYVFIYLYSLWVGFQLATHEKQRAAKILVW